ncbi:MAG TPA: ElyC/SanA/YdcF family protein [Opitutaceae bacterium]|jgi:uncharacterized SAM-binding protein YcdF (DUF218 family)|nr:ElyC/SanA/YdcF family protein [Opitutaceae bacterium]
MLFWLKKSVSFWLMPLPFCLTLLVLGILVLGSERRRRLGRRLAALGTILLLIFSNKIASNALLRPLETRFTPIPRLETAGSVPPTLAACRYVVVLGGGHSDMIGWAPNDKLSTSALERIVEAVRILRALPQAGLIVSGPGQPGQPSHASVLAQTAESLGIAAGRIQLIDSARDTEDESRAVKALVAGAPVALVTSAFHLPRAAALFRGAGVAIVPCPTDFQARFTPGFHLGESNWDVESLERSTLAVREYIGLAWVTLRGKASY